MLRIGGNKVNKVGVGAMTVGARAHRVVSNRDITGIITKGKGTIR